ncbi:hypothetical protein MYF61_29770, partial [Klebsiella quasipneumoniae]|nr:hypothetical protein [Klebsiella quasipneumoniae]
ILIIIVAVNMHLWSGVAWIISAGIILSMMINVYVLGDKFKYLIFVFSFLSYAWYSVVEFRKKKASQAR